MKQPIQPRAIATRARLLAVAEEIVAQESFTALRVEQVVRRAGVAKGTFFAHFPDKDALTGLMLARRIEALLDVLAQARRPTSAKGLARALAPLTGLITSERYVFDLSQRASLAVGSPLAQALDQLDGLLIGWFGGLFGLPPFRTDLTPALMADGVQALMRQAMEGEYRPRPGEKARLETRLARMIEAFLMAPGP